MKSLSRYFLVVLLTAVVVSPALARDIDSVSAQESEEVGATETESTAGQQPKFGGPDQVDNQIANDEASTSRIVTERLLDPYFEWKKNLAGEARTSHSRWTTRLPT